MKTKLTITLALVFFTSLLSAQTIFRGTVVDAQNKQAISSAKIGITNQGVGVVSNEQGKYTYKKYQETLSDTDKLVISAAGYETIELGAAEVRKLFNRNSTTQLEKTSKRVSNKPIKNVKIFWDISEGMQERDTDQDLASIQQYLNAQKNVSVTLEVFNNDIIETEVWKKWDGDMDRFRESVTKNTFDGPSNYSKLSFDQADAIILASNGEPNYGKLSVSQEQPVYVVASNFSKEGMTYLKDLTAYTSGGMLRSSPVSQGASISQTEASTMQERVKTNTTISGKVTSLGSPIQGATLTIKGDFAEYRTAADGSFKIPASEGDIVLVRALGMFPKAYSVQDQKEITVAMLPSTDQLDEVVISGKEQIFTGRKIIEGTNEPNMPGGVTRLGDFYITNKDITPNGKSVAEVLRQKFKGIVISYTPEGEVLTVFGRVPLWYVNGFRIGAGEPIPLYIPDNEILSIIVKEPGPARNIKYGGDGETGLQILITTKNFRDDFKEEDLLVKNNNYTEEVASINGLKKVITGKVTGPKGAIQGAEVLRKGTLDIVNTAADGSFTLKVSEGDILMVSALGTFTKEIIVTSEKTYDIKLIPTTDTLDAVTIKGEKALTESDKLWALKDSIQRKNGFASNLLLREEFENVGYRDLVNVIGGKIAGTRVVGQYPNQKIVNSRNGGLYALVIDKVLRDQEFLTILDPIIVDMIEVIPGPSGAIKYGPEAGNGIIKITTRDGGYGRKATKVRSALVSGNDYTEEVKELATAQEIKGVVTGPKGPLNDASITKKGSFNEVSTGLDGTFFIKAVIGDILVIGAPGMFSKELLIETQNVGTIKLTPKINELDALVVGGQERVDNTVETADGKINADKQGYKTETLDENDFASGYTNLRQLITGKVSGVDVAGGLYSGSEVVYKIRGGSQSINTEKPPIWIINGTPYQDVPNFIDVQQIKSITVLKSTMATSRYGSLAAGGAFLIKTKEVDFESNAAASNVSALVSGNEYTGDVTGSIDAALPSYILRFRESGTAQQQFALYKKLSRTQESPLEYYVDAVKYFQSLSPALGDAVRSDLAYIARNNTKALRTLAYLYELVDDTENVVLVNERIAKIAPQEAQSYRDLAQAYQNNKQYDKALELYINMLGEQIMGVNFDGLENPLRSELSRLVALHKDKIDYSRLPNEWLRTDFKRDLRMVIDWSDRSVPFEFQFVNPDKKFFKWTHTLEESRERLQAEQKHGFQTEEFIIDDAPSGEWIINVQYLGDEGDYALPPFLKYTVYRNYGTPKETKEVRVIKLFKQVDKVTLGRVTI